MFLMPHGHLLNSSADSANIVCMFYPTWNSATGPGCLNSGWKFSHFLPAFSHWGVDLRDLLLFSTLLWPENQDSFSAGSVAVSSGHSYCVNKLVTSEVNHTMRGIMPGSNKKHRPGEFCRGMTFYIVRKTGLIICYYFVFKTVNASYVILCFPI